MKQGTLITKVIMSILFVGVILYLCVYITRSLSDPLDTVIAYPDALDDSVEIHGLLVREERVLSNGAAIMDVLPDEGERVSAGETIAVLYQNSDALARERLIQTMQLELDQLQYALDSGSSLVDAARLEQQITNCILSLRTSVGSDDLSCLESDALALRAQVLQREFAYSATTDHTAELTQTIAQLRTEIGRMQTQSNHDTSLVKSPCSGLFSQFSDGMEDKLTPEMLATLTADQLLAFEDLFKPTPEHYVGKLITGDRWYFASVVDPSTAKRLLEGDTITVAFSRDFSGEVDMRVEHIGEPESQGCVLILSSSRHLRDVTMLREQTVSLVFNRYTGVRVPKQALRLETMTTTDPNTEQPTQVQVLGVYIVLGQQAEFCPVEIVQEGSDYYLVAPSQYAGQADIAYDGGSYILTTPGSKDVGQRILHPGDEVIVASASGVYDGKVVVE